jgi:hypothetical protein
VKYVFKKTADYNLIAQRARDAQALSMEEFLAKYPGTEVLNDENLVSENNSTIDLQKKETEKIPEPKVKQWLGYNSKMFAECSIPSTMKKGLQVYERTNGKASLRLTAVSKEWDLPYGKDRWFFYWIQTKVIQTKSEVIEFNGQNSMLAEMGMSPTGRNVNWARETIMRAHHTLIYYKIGDPIRGGLSVGELIIPKLEGINFDVKGKRQSGKIHLSPYFTKISPIPIDFVMMQKLGRSWIGMDLYSFIRKRLHNHKGGDIYIKLEEVAKHLGFTSEMSSFHIKQAIQRGIQALIDTEFEAIPYLFQDYLVIPAVKLLNIRSREITEALDHFDAKTDGPDA